MYVPKGKRAIMKMFVEDMTLEQLDAATRGEIKVYNGRVQERLRLNKTDIELFEQAKKQGYLVQSGTEWRAVTRAHYHWCRINKHPLIIVQQQRRHSTIRLEFSVGFVGYSPSQNVLDQIKDIMMRYAQPGDWLAYKYIERVPNEDAEKIASTLLAMFLQDQELEDKYNESVGTGQAQDSVVENKQRD